MASSLLVFLWEDQKGLLLHAVIIVQKTARYTWVCQGLRLCAEVKAAIDKHLAEMNQAYATAFIVVNIHRDESIWSFYPLDPPSMSLWFES